jgi:hypothetical protein
VTQYEHTQAGYLITSVLFAAAVFVAITGILMPSDPGAFAISATLEVIFLICAVVFSKMTITIDDKILHAYFAMGIRFKKVPLAEIADCEPIRTRWWFGWGIHLSPYGWLYNVSGFDAVAVILRDGRKFALGTDDPQGLVSAIRHSV